MLYSPLALPDVQRASRALLAQPGAPTAIITNSDYTAHAVYKAARELGLPVGPGVSVVGHDDLPTSELLDPPLATVGMDQREMGRALMLGCSGRSARRSHRGRGTGRAGVPGGARRAGRAPGGALTGQDERRGRASTR